MEAYNSATSALEGFVHFQPNLLFFHSATPSGGASKRMEVYLCIQP
jgi:hypothetical protein